MSENRTHLYVMVRGVSGSVYCGYKADNFKNITFIVDKTTCKRCLKQYKKRIK